MTKYTYSPFIITFQTRDSISDFQSSFCIPFLSALKIFVLSFNHFIPWPSLLLAMPLPFSFCPLQASRASSLIKLKNL